MVAAGVLSPFHGRYNSQNICQRIDEILDHVSLSSEPKDAPPAVMLAVFRRCPVYWWWFARVCTAHSFAHQSVQTVTDGLEVAFTVLSGGWYRVAMEIVQGVRRFVLRAAGTHTVLGPVSVRRDSTTPEFSLGSLATHFLNLESLVEALLPNRPFSMSHLQSFVNAPAQLTMGEDSTELQSYSISHSWPRAAAYLGVGVLALPASITFGVVGVVIYTLGYLFGLPYDLVRRFVIRARQDKGARGRLEKDLDWFYSDPRQAGIVVQVRCRNCDRKLRGMTMETLVWLMIDHIELDKGELEGKSCYHAGIQRRDAAPTQ